MLLKSPTPRRKGSQVYLLEKTFLIIREAKCNRLLLPVPVSLTGSGYPRIIPAFHRKILYRKDERSHQLEKLDLSFFSLAKIIELAKKVSKSLFKSIVEPADLDSVTSVVGCIRQSLHSGIMRRPWLATIPMTLGMRWEPTWKALPTYQVFSFHTAEMTQEIERVTKRES